MRAFSSYPCFLSCRRFQHLHQRALETAQSPLRPGARSHHYPYYYPSCPLFYDQVSASFLPSCIEAYEVRIDGKTKIKMRIRFSNPYLSSINETKTRWNSFKRHIHTHTYYNEHYYMYGSGVMLVMKPGTGKEKESRLRPRRKTENRNDEKAKGNRNPIEMIDFSPLGELDRARIHSICELGGCEALTWNKGYCNGRHRANLYLVLLLHPHTGAQQTHAPIASSRAALCIAKVQMNKALLKSTREG